MISAVLTRPDTQGIILPPIYEILPQYHLDSRIIQEAQNIAIQGIQRGIIQNIVIPVNYSSLLSNDEQQVSYFTQDVGLAAYYANIDLIEYILGEVKTFTCDYVFFYCAFKICCWLFKQYSL